MTLYFAGATIQTEQSRSLKGIPSSATNHHLMKGFAAEIDPDFAVAFQLHFG